MGDEWEEKMTVDEAESIYMAWQVGANYPVDLLPMAILLLSKKNQDCKEVEE